MAKSKKASSSSSAAAAVAESSSSSSSSSSSPLASSETIPSTVAQKEPLEQQPLLPQSQASQSQPQPPLSTIKSYAMAAYASCYETYDALSRIPKRQIAHQVLSLVLVLCSALMLWKGLIVYTGSETPVVVVLSGSMEPAFYRGDILLLSMQSKPFEVGDIIVFKIKGRDIPIVHRIIEAHLNDSGAPALPSVSSTASASSEVAASSSSSFLLWPYHAWRTWAASWTTSYSAAPHPSRPLYLTKGDNNRVDDRQLYNPGQLWLEQDDILGCAGIIIPYFGLFTIYLTEYPMIKFVLIGLMGLIVLTTKE